MSLVSAFATLRQDGAVLPFSSDRTIDPPPIGRWTSRVDGDTFLITAELDLSDTPSVWKTRLAWAPPDGTPTSRLDVVLFADAASLDLTSLPR